MVLRGMVPAAAVGIFLVASAYAAGDTSIRPGSGIGPLRLGMSRAEAAKAIGSPPATTEKVRGGYAEDTWRRPKGTTDDDRTLTALYRDNRLVQISACAPTFRTQNNVSIATPFAQVRRLYPGLAVHDFEMLEKGGGGYVLILADDVRGGIAFTTGTQDDQGTYEELPQLKPGSILVHAPGKPAIPVEFGLFGKPARPYPGGYIGRIRSYFAGEAHRPSSHR